MADPVAAPTVDRGSVVADAAGWVAQAVPYVWGGMSRLGADCSGFVKEVFAERGVSIAGRTADAQMRSGGAAVPLGPASDLTANAAPGDVLFYGYGGYASHEALYVGGGQIIQEAHAGTTASYAPATGTGLPLLAIRDYLGGAGAGGAATPTTTAAWNPVTGGSLAGGLAGLGGLGGDLASGLTAPLISWADSMALRALVVIFGLAALVLGLAKLTAPAREAAADKARSAAQAAPAAAAGA